MWVELGRPNLERKDRTNARETLAKPRRHKTRITTVWRPLGYGPKALDLPIRGGARRNHTADRIQPLVPLRSGKSSALRRQADGVRLTSFAKASGEDAEARKYTKKNESSSCFRVFVALEITSAVSWRATGSIP